MSATLPSFARTRKIHKKHCGRNIFGYCASCCKPTPIDNKCTNCPVRFCSDECKDKIFGAHVDYDCEKFAKIFGEIYLDHND